MNVATAETRALKNSIIVDPSKVSIDMTAIYRKLGLLWLQKDNADIPFIMFADLRGEEMKYINGIDPVTHKRSITFDYSCSENYILKKIDRILNREPDCNARTNITTDVGCLYFVASTISAFLKIKCPCIMISSEYLASQGLNGLLDMEPHTLIVRDDLDSGTIALIHELRHIWQHTYYEEKYFHDYSFDRADLEKYMLQDAEIDARAFSFQVMDCIGEGECFVRSGFDSVDKRIRQKMAELGSCVDLNRIMQPMIMQIYGHR